MSDSEDEARSERSASEAAEEEENELAPAGGAESGSEDEAPEPAPAPAAADAGAISLFLPYNKGFHLVTKQSGGKAGCVRCYHRTVKVESGERLGHLVDSYKAWPKGKDLKEFVSADKIVVVNGRDKEDDAETRSVWFVLFEVEGTSNRQDSQILRHIPKQVYKELIDSIKKDPTMAESSLLRMQSTTDNEKSLNPTTNGFSKVSDSEKPRSACIAVEKKKVEKKPAEKSADKTADKPKDKGSEKKDDKGDKGDKTDKSAATKQSAMSFWKPKSSAAPEEKPGEKPVERAAEKPGEKRKAEAGPTDEPPKKAEKAEKGDKSEKSKDKESKEAGDPKGNPTPKERDEPKAPPDLKRDETDSKTLFKRKRTAVVETHEFMICDPGAKVDFPMPEGATGGKATITWSFD